MLKHFATLVVVLSVFSGVAQSQTLFSYGKNTVSKEEFLKAFNKNPSLEPDRKKALREYLDLYINFKLKVQAAYDAGLQNDPSYQYETDNFRKQLAANFINEEANIRQLVEEAFIRSKKDIRLQQVFVPFTGNDTLAAYNKIQKAYFDLRGGKSFSDVSQQTTDPSAIDLGYITVFTLPYVFENIIYSTRPGGFAAPVRSSNGYHIFYNAAERPAVGRRKAAQILFAVAPDATAAERGVIRARADSVYQVLTKQPDQWHGLVHLFSNDVSTADNHGEMQEFGIGEYSPAFEAAAFSLRQAGDISRPVETEYGYHIIRLISIVPVPANLDDPIIATTFREKVERDDRLTQARKMLVHKWMKLAGFKTAVVDEKELWAYTDSFFAGGNTRQFRKVNDSTVVFSFTRQRFTASDFARYNRAMKAFPMYQSMSYPELMQEYTKAATTEYYQNHLEDYNPEFKRQLREFNDANLLFAIMDQEVWSKSTLDEKGLREHFEQHRSRYKWEASAMALVFTAANEKVLGDLQQQLAGNLGRWKQIAEGFGNEVMADSGRYELAQIPVVDRTRFTEGLTTAPVKNNDGSYTFAHILQLFPDPAPRTFEEARGVVINDYQQVLEQRWLAELRKKYPVKVNEAVFNSLK